MPMDPNVKAVTDAARQAFATANKMAREGVESAGEATHRNRAKIDGALDRASRRLEAQFGHQHAGRIERFRRLVERGIDNLEGRRRGAVSTPADGATRPDQTA